MRIVRTMLLMTLAVSSAGAAVEGPKNLQVLPKTLTREQVKEIMKAQAKALGVECDFCHEVPDMASDANKKKQIARNMLRMTEDINGKWLKMKDNDKDKVTCRTCHQGHEKPPTKN